MEAQILDMPRRVGFGDFWQATPKEKKVHRALAQAKFAAITSPEGLATKMLDRDSGEYVAVHLHATPEELVNGWKAYVYVEMAQKKTKPQYMLQPATFLNRGRWLDNDDNESLAEQHDDWVVRVDAYERRMGLK